MFAVRILRRKGEHRRFAQLHRGGRQFKAPDDTALAQLEFERFPTDARIELLAVGHQSARVVAGNGAAVGGRCDARALLGQSLESASVAGQIDLKFLVVGHFNGGCFVLVKGKGSRNNYFYNN